MSTESICRLTPKSEITQSFKKSGTSPKCYFRIVQPSYTFEALRGILCGLHKVWFMKRSIVTIGFLNFSHHH